MIRDVLELGGVVFSDELGLGVAVLRDELDLGGVLIGAGVEEQVDTLGTVNEFGCTVLEGLKGLDRES